MKKIVAILILAVLGCTVKADQLRIVIYKEKRMLELWRADAIIKTYKVGLGFAPVGKKLKSGDGKTPEGSYYVCVKNPNSKFYLSLGISYPSPSDAQTGLDSKLITKDEYSRIVSAQRKGVTPPWNTKLGGEIFIHGRGSSSDWTWGCVALDDSEMKELFQIVEVGTVVEIKK